jgi:hypothetical protein
MSSEGGQLDPRTGYADWCYGLIDPPENGLVGRTWYWFDPERRLPAVDDDDLRALYPEIDGPTWRRLLDDAIGRAFRAEVTRTSSRR